MVIRTVQEAKVGSLHHRILSILKFSLTFFTLKLCKTAIDAS